MLCHQKQKLANSKKMMASQKVEGSNPLLIKLQQFPRTLLILTDLVIFVTDT